MSERASSQWLQAMKARVSFTEVALVLSIIAFTHLIPDAPWIIESNNFFQDPCPDVLSGSWFRIVIQQRVLPGFKTGKGSRFFLMLGGQNWTQQFDRMKSPCSEKNTVTKQMNKYKRIKFLLLWKMLLSILDIAGTCIVQSPQIILNTGIFCCIVCNLADRIRQKIKK